MSDIILKQAIHPLQSLAEHARRRTVRSRLRLFIDWQRRDGQAWHTPDLESYALHLLDEGKRASTVQSYVSTVRSAYRQVLRRNDVRDRLLHDVPERDPVTGKAYSLPERLLLVNEILTRVQNAIDPAHTAHIKPRKKQDRQDNEHIRLTRQQVERLLRAPGTGSIQGLRDTALIALAVCTGVRVGELVDVRIDDLRQTVGGELALLIREGKGGKQRMVPYGDNQWCLNVVDAWLRAADITAGYVFRGFYKPRKDGSVKVRGYAISTRAVENIVGSYPVMIGGELKRIEPHDLRRTYARREFEAGAKLEIIRQNLGHEDIKTTQRYIGTLDAHTRRPAAVYNFELGGDPLES